MKVLLVDDDIAVLSRVQRALEAADGFDVTACDSPMEAMARARSEQPDVILLDLMMPTMTGATVLDHLQRDPNTSGIPVILLTGADPPAVDSLKGARGVIRKPFDIHSLPEEIRAILS
ncbi:MAG: response regulator [Gemmatimonadales bacterium]